MKTIETYLPVFPGFYGTYFEPDEGDLIEYWNERRKENKLTPVHYDVFKFDYESYQNEIGKRCCEFIGSELSSFVSKVEFQMISSPKEYNFANDSINVKITLSDDNIGEIKDYISSHSSEFEIYIRDNYTSRSGFFSYYSNKSEEWLIDFEKTLENKHQLGSLLDFICWSSDVNEYDLLEYCSGIQLEVINYSDLEYNDYCHVCKSFVSSLHFNGNCCDNCKESLIKNFDIIICSCCKEEITNKSEIRHFTYLLKHHITTYGKVICTECECIHA
jgi:hypothetical protein